MVTPVGISPALRVEATIQQVIVTRDVNGNETSRTEQPVRGTLTHVNIPTASSAEVSQTIQSAIGTYPTKEMLLTAGLVAAAIIALIPKINGAVNESKRPLPSISAPNLSAQKHSGTEIFQKLVQKIGRYVLAFIGKHPKISAGVSLGIGSTGYVKTISDTIKRIVRFVKTNPIKCSFLAGGVTVSIGIAGALFIYNQRHPQQIQNAGKALINEGKKMVEEAGKKIAEQALEPQINPSPKNTPGLTNAAARLLQKGIWKIAATLLPNEGDYATAIKNKETIKTLQLLCFRAWKVGPSLELYK